MTSSVASAAGPLIVQIPEDARAEREYACAVVLQTLLGLACRVVVTPGLAAIRIGLEGDPRYVEVADVFFPSYFPVSSAGRCLPPRELRSWLPPPWVSGAGRAAEMPVLYGRPDAQGEYLAGEAQKVTLGIDVFGSAFMMLTRCEEAFADSADPHQRFQFRGSLADRAGLWSRPLVDEYAQLLLHALRMLWPSLPAPEASYRLCVSHDVDRLFSVVRRNWSAVVRNAFGDVLARADPLAASRRIAARIGASFGSWRREPLNTFDYIMETSERRGIVSAFYFIPGHTEPRWDGDYDLDDPWVRELLQSIHRRGHEIGLHGSYRSAEDPGMLRREFERLRTVADQLAIRQERWGGRQHYLRWSPLRSWASWQQAGLSYDSTLGFAEHVGFRCGTCREFPVFDLPARRRLDLTERPLIAMDVTLLSPQYMGLDATQALAHIGSLAAQCRRHGGNLTLLWHNTSLVTPQSKRLYESVLEAAT